MILTNLVDATPQKHVVHNQNMRGLDLISQLLVIRADYTDPPESPGNGDIYIPYATAGGDWTGHENKLAMFYKGEWVIIPPVEGWRAYDQTRDLLIIYNGTNWVSPFHSFLASGALKQLGINNTPSASTRLALAATYPYLDRETDDALLTMNKDATASDLGISLDINDVPTFRIGNFGDDDTVLQATASLTEAMRFGNSSGLASVATGKARFLAYMNHDQALTADSTTYVDFNTEVYDIGSNYSPTGKNFSPPRAGYYRYGIGFTLKVTGSVPTRMMLYANCLHVSVLRQRTIGSSISDGRSISLELLVYHPSTGSPLAIQARFDADASIEANTNYFWGYEL